MMRRENRLRCKKGEQVEQRKVKQLFYDIEVCRDIVEGYGSKWDFKVVKWVRHQELMCYSYKWRGEKKPTFVYRHQFSTMKEFLTSIRDLQDQADICVAHNGKKFDDKMMNRFYVKNKVELPSPFFSIDTLQVARSKFKFPGNSLNDLAEYLELGEKEHISYKDLEEDFMSANPKPITIRLMKKYNNKDVELLEKLYDVMLPAIPNHPNMARLSNCPDACPQCGNDNEELINREKYRPTKMGLYMQYKCKVCKKYFQSARPIDPLFDVKPRFRNIAGN